MKNYELLYILPSNMTGAEIKSTFLEIEKEIENFGAKKLVTLLDHPFLSKTEISKEEGAEELKNIPAIKRKLAYPIEKNRFGFYCLFNFSAEEKNLKEIDYYLRMNKTVIRHFILQSNPMTEDELKLLHKLFARKKAEQDKEQDKEKSDKEARKAERVTKGNIEKKKAIEIKEEVKAKEEKEVKVKAKEAEEVKEEKVEKPEEEKKIKKEKEVEKTVAAEDKKEKVEEAKKEKKAKKGEKEPTSKRKPKVKLEDLEDKLDEILENAMI